MSRLGWILCGLVVALFGWLGGFGEALLPDPWRGGVTGVLLALLLVVAVLAPPPPPDRDEEWTP